MNKELIVELKRLYEKSSFYGEDKEDLVWDSMDFYEKEEEDDNEEYIPVFVEQGSHFANTLVCLDDTYENSGIDCLLIQKLIQNIPEILGE